MPGDPAVGGKLARDVCATCHVVSEDQVDDPGVGAPTFFEVAAHPSVTALSLRVFFQTPHATMPNLTLSPEETDDIISYLLTLRGHQVEAIYDFYTPGEEDFTALVARLQREQIDVLYVGGQGPDAGLIVRTARERGFDLQIVSGDALGMDEL